jgi:ATP-dependent Clp protease ATP-binding subunit ClpA
MNWFKSFWKALNTPMPRDEHESFEAMNSFTPRAQQVLALARKEADRFNHNFVGTEHLLLGLIKLGQGVAVNVLQKLGLDLEIVRMEVEKQVGTGPDQEKVGIIPYTPRVKKCLALAATEAKALNHTYVGTEHILLGLLREGDGVAARVLKNLDVDIEQTRQEILRELDPNFAATPDDTVKPQKPEPSKPKSDLVDASKRYDIYCSERNQEVVYRNSLFKAVKKLFSKNEWDMPSQFLEIEQADGKTIFVAKASVIKFCEHEVPPDSEKE